MGGYFFCFFFLHTLMCLEFLSRNQAEYLHPMCKKERKREVVSVCVGK
jgi:hypothetical protein